jgi:hypothetical protein
MRMTVQTYQLLQDSGASEYIYHDRTAWRCAFLWAKNMDAAKDIHKEMLPIWAEFLCGYPFACRLQLRCYRHAPTVKPEVVNAVVSS